jgi:hypothetical protein
MERQEQSHQPPPGTPNWRRGDHSAWGLPGASATLLTCVPFPMPGASRILTNRVTPALAHSAEATPPQHHPSRERACAEIRRVFASMRFIPPQGLLMGVSAPRRDGAVDQRRYRRLPHPLQ